MGIRLLTHGSTRLQLEPVLILLPIKQLLELACSLVPEVHLVHGRSNTSTVRVVPSNLEELCLGVIVSKDRDRIARLHVDAFVASSVGIDAEGRKRLVKLWGFLVKLIGAFESVDEERLAAFAVLMRE